MNRRNFMVKSALGLFSFTILPGAGRLWKVSLKPVNPMWVDAPHEVMFWSERDYVGRWGWVYSDSAGTLKGELSAI